jgi:hypothetical protein
MRPVSIDQVVFFIFTALSLASLITAVPQGRAPTPLALERRKPPQPHAPGCPTARFAHAQSQYFLRGLYEDDIVKKFGSYNGYTQDRFWDNFTIKDITPNYPAATKGKKLPAPGRWAKSRFGFGNKLTEVLPKIRDIFGDIRTDDNELNFGGSDDKDCLTAFWKGTYIATLRKPYGYVAPLLNDGPGFHFPVGEVPSSRALLTSLLPSNRGKPTGKKVTWKHYHEIELRKPQPDPNGASYQIQNATVNMDWSAFYKA